tara:strand:+ start:47 stop:778 length:732 start_codon:yes stop_codon:yes gene_type:complete
MTSNLWYPKEKPIQGITGWGGGATGLRMSGTLAEKQYYFGSPGTNFNAPADGLPPSWMTDNQANMGCGWGMGGYNADLITFQIQGSGTFKLTHIGYGSACSGTGNEDMSMILIDGENSGGTVLYRQYSPYWNSGDDTSSPYSFKFLEGGSGNVGALPMILNRGSWYTIGFHYTSISSFATTYANVTHGCGNSTWGFNHNGALRVLELKDTNFTSGGYGNTGSSNGSCALRGVVCGIGFIMIGP